MSEEEREELKELLSKVVAEKGEVLATAKDTVDKLSHVEREINSLLRAEPETIH